MKILVTGGAGYLGSVLVPMLLDAGHEVTALDNFMYGQTSLAQCCAEPKFALVRGDCRDDYLMGKLLSAADVFIPLAAIVGAPACENNPEAWDVNCAAIEQALRLCKPELKIIIPTTNSGYGIGGQGECTEDSPLNPVSIYGKSKVAAEGVVLGKGGVSLRLATLFGCSPRMRFDLLVNDFCRRAVTDGFVVLFEAHFRRNYLHVRDAARAIIWAIEHYGEMANRPYNVGLPDANLTKRQLCERIRGRVPGFYFVEAEVGEDIDKRDYLVSNDRMLATGWRPWHSLDDGIEELVRAMPMYSAREWRNA